MQFEKGNRLKSVIIKNKEYILYLIFGALTTFVNFLIYYLFTYILKVNYLISNCLAWLSAVIFAFVTNKTIVFNNYNISLKII
ncbi:MAG: GtrA family protein, partial [Clostridiales bacterium]